MPRAPCVRAFSVPVMIFGELKIFPSVAELVWETAAKISAVLRAGIHATGSASLVLSGGSTPRSVYDMLASENWRGTVEWPKVHLLWGDERCVPSTAPESNYRMANETLIRKIAIPSGNVHRVQTEHPPQEAAQLYQKEIRKALQLREGELPRFTLVLLGLGPDGHVASLFPNSPALQEHARLVTENFVESLKASRITMTLPVINNALTVLVLVTGKGKAGILKAVSDADVPVYPANMVHPTSGTATWLVDVEAASQLQPHA